MAEGGGFDNENPDLDYHLDHDDDYEQEVNTTRPFQPAPHPRARKCRKARGTHLIKLIIDNNR